MNNEQNTNFSINEAKPQEQRNNNQNNSQVIYTASETKSDRSWVVLILLSFFLGVYGADRFYVGRIGLGIFKLLTFGGLGVWAFVDFIIALAGAMKDENGLLIKN